MKETNADLLHHLLDLIIYIFIFFAGFGFGLFASLSYMGISYEKAL